MKKVTYTYRDNLQTAIVALQDALKNDSYDWTKQYASTYLNTAIKYINDAKEIIE